MERAAGIVVMVQGNGFPKDYCCWIEEVVYSTTEHRMVLLSSTKRTCIDTWRFGHRKQYYPVLSSAIHYLFDTAAAVIWKPAFFCTRTCSLVSLQPFQHLVLSRTGTEVVTIGAPYWAPVITTRWKAWVRSMLWTKLFSGPRKMQINKTNLFYTCSRGEDVSPIMV